MMCIYIYLYSFIWAIMDNWYVISWQMHVLRYWLFGIKTIEVYPVKPVMAHTNMHWNLFLVVFSLIWTLIKSKPFDKLLRTYLMVIVLQSNSTLPLWKIVHLNIWNWVKHYEKKNIINKTSYMGFLNSSQVCEVFFIKNFWSWK